MTDLTRRAVLAGAAAVAASNALGADDPWRALASPGRVGIMRHALAPGTGDPATFRLGDCSTQRNLSDRGRQQAEATGAAIRGGGIPVDRVLTSEWCRCAETARLLDVGPVVPFPVLNSFFRDRSTAESQTQALRRFLSERDGPSPVILVTHQVNITALTGRGVSSGELFVLEVGPGGDVEVVARALIPA